MTTNVSLPEFYNMLANHDWWYEMSDDYRVSSAGRDRQAELQTIARQSNRHDTLFTAYELHARRGFEKPNKPYFQLGWNVGNGNQYASLPTITRNEAKELTDTLNSIYGYKTHWVTEEWVE